MNLFEYFYGLLTYKDTVDVIDYILRTFVWIIIVIFISYSLSFLYHLIAIKEEKNKRRIQMKIVFKDEIRKFNGTCTGSSWFPPTNFYELELECPSSGFCFTINDQNLYMSSNIGDMVDVEIVEIYSKVFFNPFQKDFLKFKITDFKKVSSEQ